MAVHHLGRAAEVQVDAGRPEFGQPPGVFSQADRVGTEQLGAHRHAGQRAAAVVQLGNDAGEHALGQQLVGDADEFGHAAVNAAHARQDVAQHEVEQPFHGREQDHGFAKLRDRR